MAESGAVEIILWASDVSALAAFLEQVTESELLEQHPGLAMLSTRTTRLSIHADEAYEGHPWWDALHREGMARGIGAELLFTVSDVSAAYRKAIRAGASVVYPPHEQDGVVECQVLAPDGYMVTLRQQG